MWNGLSSVPRDRVAGHQVWPLPVSLKVRGAVSGWWSVPGWRRPGMTVGCGCVEGCGPFGGCTTRRAGHGSAGDRHSQGTRVGCQQVGIRPKVPQTENVRPAEAGVHRSLGDRCRAAAARWRVVRVVEWLALSADQVQTSPLAVGAVRRRRRSSRPRRTRPAFGRRRPRPPTGASSARAGRRSGGAGAAARPRSGPWCQGWRRLGGAERHANGGAVLVGPGRLDQLGADMGVAGSGQRTPAGGRARGAARWAPARRSP